MRWQAKGSEAVRKSKEEQRSKVQTHKSKPPSQAADVKEAKKKRAHEPASATDGSREVAGDAKAGGNGTTGDADAQQRVAGSNPNKAKRKKLAMEKTLGGAAGLGFFMHNCFRWTE